MPSGLVALLDDIAGITKLAAASLDDVGAAAGKAGGKTLGVVVDDTAVTPRYVGGLSPQRELPMIAKIAAGSLRNKLLILLPASLLLSAFAPWAITPLLMVGGAYLCFEGAEKLLETFADGDHAAPAETATDAVALEAGKVAAAIRTDLILSAEIMAIALASVADESLPMQAAVLALVGTGITIGVYGLVGVIVKMDDIGLHFARGEVSIGRAVGRALVQGMPIVMSALSGIGTAAMLWVGGGILVHGAEGLGFAAPAHIVHHMSESIRVAPPALGDTTAWLVLAAMAGLIGSIVGAALAGGASVFARVRRSRADRQ